MLIAVNFVQNTKFMQFIKDFHDNDLSRDMTKPTKWLCAQRRLKSAWASAPSDQSSLCTE